MNDSPHLWINRHTEAVGVGLRCDARAVHGELDWPLRGWEAVDAGLLSARELRRSYVPAYPGVHIPRGAELSARQRARAAWLWSRRRGVLAGLSAAAVLGAKWIEPGLAAELVHANRRPPPMLTVHSDHLASAKRSASRACR